MMLDDALAAACTFGSTERVRALLAAQPEASKRAPYAEDCPSLLHHAASAGHAEVVALLLEAGADSATVDEDGQTALHHASSEGHIDRVKLLAPMADCPELYATDKYQMTAYHLACENGHEACVGHMLTLLEQPPSHLEPRAAQLRRGSALFLAQQGGHDHVVETINASWRGSVVKGPLETIPSERSSEATLDSASSSSSSGSPTVSPAVDDSDGSNAMDIGR